MKVSPSTLIGILLIAGALVLQFSRSKPAIQKQPTSESAYPSNSGDSKSFQVYSRQELKALAPAAHFKTSSQAYLQAKGLVEASRHNPATDRHQALLQALAILYRVQREDHSWKTKLVSRRLEQTVIAILELQGNFSHSVSTHPSHSQVSRQRNPRQSNC